MEETKPKRWFITRLFPSREVHLIGGPSGAGKTRWLLDIIREWKEGRDIYGYTSHPQPFLYISCDRSKESVQTTLDDLGLDIPFKSLPEDFYQIPKSLAGLEKLFLLHPNVRIFFFDAIAVFCSKPNDYNFVETFLTGIMRLCKKYNITVFGTTHATKVKEGENFPDVRQRIIGSAAWAAFSDTVCILEKIGPQDESGERKIYILPRNAKEFAVRLRFDENGRFKQLADPGEAGADFLLDSFLEPGKPFSTKDAIEYGKQKNLSNATVERWLKKRQEEKLLVKLEKGKYTLVD